MIIHSAFREDFCNDPSIGIATTSLPRIIPIAIGAFIAEVDATRSHFLISREMSITNSRLCGYLRKQIRIGQ